MRRITVEGGNPAWVQDVATQTVCLPDDDEVTQRLAATDYGQLRDDANTLGTITLGEYWEQRCAGQPTVLPFCQLAPFLPPPSAPHDSFTVDAEILVERAGHAVFTAADIGALLGCGPSGVRHRLAAGNVPKPRFPSYKATDGENVPHRWAPAQVVEILAAHLRRVHAA